MAPQRACTASPSRAAGEASPRENHGGRPRAPLRTQKVCTENVPRPGREDRRRQRRQQARQSRDLALAYRALPAADLPPMATKPVRPSSLRAFFTASAQAFRPFFSHCFFPCADCFFDTTFPALFLINLSFVMPAPVFCFLPEKTRALAPLPRAMTLTFLAFIAFMAAFMVPAFFIPAFFIAAAFITAFFIGSAMAAKNPPRSSGGAHR